MSAIDDGQRALNRRYSDTAISTTPAVINIPPSAVFHEKDSPNTTKEINNTSTTLSLSTGATRDAGPSCSAL